MQCYECGANTRLVELTQQFGCEVNTGGRGSNRTRLVSVHCLILFCVVERGRAANIVRKCRGPGFAQNLVDRSRVRALKQHSSGPALRDYCKCAAALQP